MNSRGMIEQHCLQPCLGSMTTNGSPSGHETVGGLRFGCVQGDQRQPLLNLNHFGRTPGCDGGQQLFTVSSVTLQPIIMDGRQLGYWYECEQARVAWLWGVYDDSCGSREQQASGMFTGAGHALQQAGMSWTDVVRTWLYLDHLLDWYDEFNAIRTGFYREQGVLDGLVPASTGIGIGNHAGAACSMGLLAFQPKAGLLSVRSAPSPMQNPATLYRSSFSRVIEIETSHCRQLMVSGTASIDPQGWSVHTGDPKKQIELTMQVVQAILASRGMGWSDTSRAIAYFKKPEYAELFKDYCIQADIRLANCLFVQADICREELLFELELDAKINL